MTWRSVTVSTAILLGACLPPSAAAQGSLCLQPTPYRAPMKEYVDSLVTSNDAAWKEQRDSLKLAKTTLSKVNWITTGNNCTAASQAVDTRLNTPGSGRLVYLIQIGTSFAVMDTTVRQGEYRTLFFFDKLWKFLSALGL